MANKSRFGLGLILGAVGGALAGLFLSPKSGKENREALAKMISELREAYDKGELKEKAQEIFGDATEESMKLLTETKNNLVARLNEIRDNAGGINAEKYKTLVTAAIDEVKDKNKVPTEKLGKLKDYLIKDWNKLIESK